MREITFINNFPGPSIGGAEVQLLTLLKGMLRAGLAPSVICAGDSALRRELEGMGDIEVIPVDFARHALPTVIRSLRRKTKDCAIIQGTGYLTNLIARSIKTGVNTKVINRVANVPGASRFNGESRPVSVVRDLLDRASREKVDRFVAISHAVRAGLVEKGVPESDITLIPIGIDIVRIRQDASRPLDIGLDPAAKRVGFVGRLELHKGCEYFIRAIPLLATVHPDTSFVVAGTGSQEDALRRLARDLGVSHRVQFLGFLETALPLLSTLDVTIVPSTSEAAGNTAMEALALGVPVVASNVGGLPESVVDGETGLLVPPGDAGAIATAADRMLKDPSWARGLASNGTKLVEQRFPAEKMITRYMDLYQELTS